MKQISKYVCEHCNTVYDHKATAMKCEEVHIQCGDLFIFKALHTRPSSVTGPEGHWPTTLIVSLEIHRDDVKSRYKYDGEHRPGDENFL